jgi:hypothetical protein
MKHATPIAIVVLLTGLLGQLAAAQTSGLGLTNTDIARLVAARVSDQTVMTVIREATATQFDLSSRAVVELAGQEVSSAVIAAMRKVAATAPPPTASAANAIALPEPAPAAGAQTLAGAAAEAALSTHTWPVSATSSSELPAKTPDAPDAAATGAVTAFAADEASWRARVAPLHQALRDDRAKEGPLLNRINKFTGELSALGPSSVKRSGIETERQKLTIELTALRESLRTDMASTQALEDEGRRAGVPSEWLR